MSTLLGMLTNDSAGLLQVNVGREVIKDAISAGTYRPEDATTLTDVREPIFNVWPDQPPHRFLHIFVIPSGGGE
jgi:hypothetical protein